MKRSVLSVIRTLQICSLLLSMLVLFSAIGSAQKLYTTNRFSVVGRFAGLYVAPDTSISTISFFVNSKLILSMPVAPVFPWLTDSAGFLRVWANISYKNGSKKMTDTLSMFVASRDEFAAIALEALTYNYRSRTYPDTLIPFPSNAIMLGYSKPATGKTTIKYLNPTVK